MYGMTENEKELKILFDNFIIDGCVKPFKDVAERTNELFQYSSEYGEDLNKKLNEVLNSLKKDELRILKLQMRMEKILELVIKERKINHTSREKIYNRSFESITGHNCTKESSLKNKPNYLPENNCIKVENRDERTLSSSINSLESVPVNYMVKRSIEYNNLRKFNNKTDLKNNCRINFLSKFQTEPELSDEITVNITSDDSARSLISKYINGKKSSRENGIEKNTRIRDPNSKKREKIDNVKRIVKPLNLVNDNRSCSWKNFCCISFQSPTKLGNYFKMSVQQWKDFLNSIQIKNESYGNHCGLLRQAKDSSKIGIEGLSPLIVEYSSLNVDQEENLDNLIQYDEASTNNKCINSNEKQKINVNRQIQDNELNNKSNSLHQVACRTSDMFLDQYHNLNGDKLIQNRQNKKYQTKGVEMQEDVKLRQVIHEKVETTSKNPKIAR